jgi:integrase
VAIDHHCLSAILRSPVVAELRKLLAELQNPARALFFLTAATGLRVSEALGLKWSDVEFGTRMINLSRAVVHQHVGEMKTEASQKPIPMAGALANALLEWSGQTPYRQPEDWVFAKTTQELMRHANAGITMNLYAQALTPAKRAAHLKVVEMIRPAARTASVPLCSHALEAESVSA